MIRRPPRATPKPSSAASDVYKRQRQTPYSEKVKWRDSTGSAWTRNAPFKFYKQNQHEGGIATPAILHWPAGLKTPKGSINHDPAHLIDVLPTMLAMSGTEMPTEWPGRSLSELSGESLTPIFEGGELVRKHPIHFQYANNRALRDGKWKLVSLNDSAWELYDMEQDRTELNNVIDSHPEIALKMSQEWDQISTKNSGKDFKPQNDLPNTEFFNERWTAYSKKGAAQQ